MFKEVFPKDIWTVITEQCDVLTVVAICKTCRRFHTLFKSRLKIYQETSEMCHLFYAAEVNDRRLVDVFIKKEIMTFCGAF